MSQESIDNKYLYSEITSKIIGCAMTVHSKLGCNFPEKIYQNSLALEFDKKNIKYKKEVAEAIYYNDVKVGSRIADFIVDDKILIELKALHRLERCTFTQIINYLEAYKLEVGLLLNFGEKSLRFKRFVNSKVIQNTIS